MTPTRKAAQERIRRLQQAIGDGPHAASIDPDEQLRLILATLQDDAALDLLGDPAKAVA